MFCVWIALWKYCIPSFLVILLHTFLDVFWSFMDQNSSSSLITSSSQLSDVYNSFVLLASRSPPSSSSSSTRDVFTISYCRPWFVFPLGSDLDAASKNGHMSTALSAPDVTYFYTWPRKCYRENQISIPNGYWHEVHGKWITSMLNWLYPPLVTVTDITSSRMKVVGLVNVRKSALINITNLKQNSQWKIRVCYKVGGKLKEFGQSSEIIIFVKL